MSSVSFHAQQSHGLVHAHTHSSMYCFVPPHILRAIRLNGDPEQQRAALRTLLSDSTIRARRSTLGPTRPSMLTTPLGGAAPTPHRTIYDAQHGDESSLPGVVMRTETGPVSPDLDVNNAFDSLGVTFNFYWQIFQRNSIDDNGLPLDASVHYQTDYDNAFWNREQMIFGDGDGRIFRNLTGAIDVVGHELTHGVTQYTCGLAYHDQPGALNESISDVFGSLVKQFKLGQAADQADWLIGADILAPGIHGVALRSMKAPGTAYDDPVLGKDPQPATMDAYVHGFADGGGVHINSGIPNHAFFLVATGIGGNAWEAPGHIWYATLLDRMLSPEASFGDFAARTIANAGTLYGQGGKQQQAVIDAWQQVGVEPSVPVATPEPVATMSLRAGDTAPAREK